MKTKYIILLFCALLILGCSEDENETNDQNPTTQNPSNEDYSADGVERNFVTEGIYVFTQDMKTDNPSVDKVMRSGVSYYYDNNIISQGTTIVAVAGQVMNANKDVYDIPHITDYGYSIVSFIYGEGLTNSSLTPNAKLKVTQSVNYATGAGNQGTDANGQNVSTLTDGAYEIIANTGSGVLAQNSQGNDVIKNTYQIKPNDFSRFTDNIVSGLGANVPQVIQEAFVENGQGIEIHILEITTANPISNEDGNPSIPGNQATTYRFN